MNRLGYGFQAPEEIKGHSFFRAVDWEKVENREEEPPFVPPLVLLLNVNQNLQLLTRYLQKGRKDLAHFDADFTAATTELTPTDKLFMMNLDQTDFIGFSYLNPEFLTYA